ncbi:MAG TPA: hypothetical protein VMU86_07460, partial [Steroidobacteraceae bacterium]|nr:hypothetical protein [Steroidobacteraceae bacterium]
MKMENQANRWALIAPALAGLAALCVVAAAGFTLFGAGSDAGAASQHLALTLRRLPLEAGGALQGTAASFDALAADDRRAQAARAVLGGANEAAWRDLAVSVDAIEAARPAVQTVQAADGQMHDRAPKLLAQLGDLASTGGAGKLAGVGAYLDRYQLTVQRLEQDVDALAAGVGGAAPIAQRLADDLESLNGIARTFGAGSSAAATPGKAAPSVAGAAGGNGLADFRRENRRFDDTVREAIGATALLAKAQAATRSLAQAAAALADQASAEPGSGGAAVGRGRIAAITALAIALICLGALVWAYRKAVGLRRAAESRARENERNQEAIMR